MIKGKLRYRSLRRLLGFGPPRLAQPRKPFLNVPSHAYQPKGSPLTITWIISADVPKRSSNKETNPTNRAVSLVRTEYFNSFMAARIHTVLLSSNVSNSSCGCFEAATSQLQCRTAVRVKARLPVGGTRSHDGWQDASAVLAERPKVTVSAAANRQNSFSAAGGKMLSLVTKRAAPPRAALLLLENGRPFT